ncbi:MAG: hypothetical protein IJ597_03755 [Synergistaceae bacterium]|nr:hypothetical protein [Synergistaceae bacterium]
MNVINELETRTTPAEKMNFLETLQNDLLSDLYLVYGRIGYATREEKIVIIAHCDKTRAEKLHEIKRLIVSAKRGTEFFRIFNDPEEVAMWKRILRRLKAWKGFFQNETKN